MAITVMVNDDFGLKLVAEGSPDIKVLDNYCGHETWRVSHSYDCPHNYSNAKGIVEEGVEKTIYSDCVTGPGGCRHFRPLYMHTTHRGLVVETRERNFYDDSDFYAVVYNPEKDTFENVEYASTRYWTYPNGAAVDASPEIMEKYRAHNERLGRLDLFHRQQMLAKTPAKGKFVTVVRGRKVPVGTVAEVFWYGESRYGGSRWSGPKYNVGLRMDDGTKVFTAATNVEVNNPTQYINEVLVAEFGAEG